MSAKKDIVYSGRPLCSSLVYIAYDVAMLRGVIIIVYLEKHMNGKLEEVGVLENEGELWGKCNRKLVCI